MYVHMCNFDYTFILMYVFWNNCLIRCDVFVFFLSRIIDIFVAYKCRLF